MYFQPGREEDSIFDAFGHNPEPPVDYNDSSEDDSEEEDSSGCEADMADIVSTNQIALFRSRDWLMVISQSVRRKIPRGARQTWQI